MCVYDWKDGGGVVYVKIDKNRKNRKILKNIQVLRSPDPEIKTMNKMQKVQFSKVRGIGFRIKRSFQYSPEGDLPRKTRIWCPFVAIFCRKC